MILLMGGTWGEADAEDVAFYQAGGFGGCYKNTFHDGEYLYTTHYQGMSIFDISDPDNPDEIGFCLTNGFAYGLWVDGDHAYIGNGYESLLVVDVTDRTDPYIVGEIENEWFASGVFVQDDYAYVADGYFQAQDQGGLLIYDVSDPTTPTRTGKLSTPQGGPNEVIVIDEYAYVANGQDGLLIVDITNKQIPQRVGSFSTSYACDLAVRDNYAYIADRTGGLVIVDHSIKQFPMQVGAYDTDGEAWGIELVGDLVYIADHEFGLQIIDVSNPNLPVKVGEMDTDDEAMKVTVVGDRAFIADNTNGLVVADISITANPQQTGHFETAGMVVDVELADGYVYVCNNDILFILEASDVTYPKAVGFFEATGNGEGEGIHAAVNGNYCYLANGEAGLVILDISDKSDPQQVGQSDTDGLALDVFVMGDHAFVVDGENGLVIIDISNPMLPHQVGHYDTNDIARRIVVRDDLAYVGDRFEDLQILDVANPMNPTFVGNWTQDDGHVNGVALSGDYAYLSTGDQGLRIIHISDPSNPVEVGDYPTEGWAMLGVNVIGNYALLGDNLNGIVIVNVTDPANPTMEFHYDTPDASSVIEVLGNYAFVADRYNGLIIGEVTGLMGGTPRAIIEEIAPSPAFTDQEISLQGSASGGSGSYDRYVWRSNLDGELYDGPETSFIHEDFGAGNHTIYLKVQDSEGTWSYEERASFQVGNRPEVTVDSHEDDEEVEGEIELLGRAWDDDGDHTLQLVEMKVDDDDWIEVNGTVNWDHKWNTTEVGNGEHILAFRCMDDIGYSFEDTLTLVVANEGVNTPPELSITSPDDGDTVSGIFGIEGTALDKDGDETIEYVEMSVDDGDWYVVDGTSTWSVEIDSSEYENGEHSFTFRAFDGEDHSKVEEITLNVENDPENTPPGIEIGSPSDGDEVSEVVTFSGSAIDVDGSDTIETVEVSIDDGEWTEVQMEKDEDEGRAGRSTGEDEKEEDDSSEVVNWSYELDSTTLENGAYTFNFRAFDGKDHSDLSTITVNVKNEAPNSLPEVEVISHQDNGTVVEVVSIAVRATDADGDDTIVSVEYSMDGVNWEPMTFAGVWSYYWNTETVADGAHVLQFRAFDGLDHSEVETITLIVENGDGGEGDDDDDGIDDVVIFGSAGVLLVAAFGAFMWLMWGRQGRNSEEEDDVDCPDCGEKLDFYEEYDNWYCRGCEEYKE